MSLSHLHFRLPLRQQHRHLSSSLSPQRSIASATSSGPSLLDSTVHLSGLLSAPIGSILGRYCLPAAVGNGVGGSARTSVDAAHLAMSSSSSSSESSPIRRGAQDELEIGAGIGRWTGRTIFVSPSPQPEGEAQMSKHGSATSPISVHSSPSSSDLSRCPSPESRQPSTPLPRPRGVPSFASPISRTAFTPPRPFYEPSPVRQQSSPMPTSAQAIRVHPFFTRTFGRSKSSPGPNTPPPPASQRPRMVANYSSTSESQASTATGAESTFGSQPRSRAPMSPDMSSPSARMVVGQKQQPSKSLKSSQGFSSQEIDGILSQMENIDLTGKFKPNPQDAARAEKGKGKMKAKAVSTTTERSGEQDITDAARAAPKAPSAKSALSRYGRTSTATTSTAGPKGTIAAVVENTKKNAEEVYPLPPAGSSRSRSDDKTSTSLVHPHAAIAEALPFFRHSEQTPAPEVRYTTSLKEADELLRRLEGPVLGLDLEWPTKWWDKSQNKWVFGPAKTALIQVCDEKLVVLLHLKGSDNLALPPRLIEIMEDPEIYKCGVQVRGDGKKLLDDFPKLFTAGTKSLLELSKVARSVDPVGCGPGRGLISLANLTKNYLGRELEKDSKVRQSNWSLSLNQKQVDYGANDVYAGLKVYLHLKKLGQDLNRGIDLDRCCDSYNADGTYDYSLLTVPPVTAALPVTSETPGVSADTMFEVRLAHGQVKYPPPAQLRALALFRAGHDLHTITNQNGVKRATIEGYICQALVVLHENTLSTEDMARLEPQLEGEYTRQKFRKLIVRLKRGAGEGGVDSGAESGDESLTEMMASVKIGPGEVPVEGRSGDNTQAEASGPALAPMAGAGDVKKLKGEVTESDWEAFGEASDLDEEEIMKG